MRPQFMNKTKVSPIYLLPSMFTLAAMFCGFYAIIQSVELHFIQAGIAILFAMIFDSIDGRVARLTHTSSPFGAELDSLSDMVSFGVAPAMMAFSWQLHTLGKFGWLVAFIYCACTGLRLARFNTLIGIVDKKYFVGLSSPAAAVLVVGFIYICNSYDFTGKLITTLTVAITLIAAFSMVCNTPFYSFKEFHFHQKAPFRSLLIFLLVLTLLIIYPDLVIFGFVVSYTIISHIIWLLNLKNKKHNITRNTINNELSNKTHE